MAGLNDRLKRAEAQAQTETPWWSLPVGVEPDYPRPLRHWTVYEMAALKLKDIYDYVDASERGEGYCPSSAQVWLSNEAWHEFRWRRYGIVRRDFASRVQEPLDSEVYAEGVRLELHDLDWDALGVRDYVGGDDAA
jgi:hypothetical protein